MIPYSPRILISTESTGLQAFEQVKLDMRGALRSGEKILKLPEKGPEGKIIKALGIGGDGFFVLDFFADDGGSVAFLNDLPLDGQRLTVFKGGLSAFFLPIESGVDDASRKGEREQNGGGF